MPTGRIIPPPKPCRKRKAISEPADHASPQATEPIPNSATAVIHTRLEPKRSENQPLSGITIASASR